MSALYRKYRPQTFADVVGQEHVKKILSQEIKRGEIAHAFLFMGPRGVGKTTLARILAKSLNCLNRKKGEYEPCNKCANCAAINKGSDFDIIEIDAASHTGVDNVRENIISVSKIASAPNKNKVFIIDEVHMLSTSAFNALLKTLEEPPKNVYFILATTEIHKVPQTIISRCQRFDFKKISFNGMVGRLKKIVDEEKVKIDEKILQNITYNSDGCLRDAESLLAQVLSLDEKEITLEQAEIVLPVSDMNLIFSLVEMLVKKDAKGAITLVNESVTGGTDIIKMTQGIIELMRKIIFVKINPELNEFTKEFDDTMIKKVSEIAEMIDEGRIFNIIDILNKRLLEIKSSKIIQLPLEMAIIEICLLDNGGFRAGIDASKENVQNMQSEASTIKKEAVSGAFRLQDIQFIWSRVVQGAKKYNNSLSSILQSAVLKELSGSKLTAALKYEFHQKKLNEVKNKHIVQEIIKENTGQTVEFNPVFDSSIKINAEPERNGEILEDLNEVFGDDLK